MLKHTKIIKNSIYIKKLNDLDSFVILFQDKNIKKLKKNKITKTQFLKWNQNIFQDKNIPANIYFYNFKTLDELEKIKENIILIKFKNNYFYKNQLKYLKLDQNITRINQVFSNYKKFFNILKTISVKE